MAVPIAIDQLGAELEQKIDTSYRTNKSESENGLVTVNANIGKVSSRVDEFEKIFSEKLANVDERYKCELEALHERIDTIAQISHNAEAPQINELKTELSKCHEKLAGYEAELSKTNRRLNEAINTLQTLTKNSDGFQSIENTNRIEHKQHKMFEELSDRMSCIEYNVRRNTKAQINLDIWRRKQNAIIDQLGEIQNENLIGRINTILDNTLSRDDRDRITIKHAYRVGKYRADQRMPRKIMIVLDSPAGKEILLKNEWLRKGKK